MEFADYVLALFCVCIYVGLHYFPKTFCFADHTCTRPVFSVFRLVGVSGWNSILDNSEGGGHALRVVFL